MNAKINIFTLVLFGAAASLFGGSSAAECRGEDEKCRATVPAAKSIPPTKQKRG